MPRRLASAGIAVVPSTAALPANTPPLIVTFCHASPEAYSPSDMNDERGNRQLRRHLINRQHEVTPRPRQLC